MPLLQINLLTDANLLGELYADPYVARIGHDHRAATPIIHPNARYMGAYVDEQFVGAFLIIESGYIEQDVHALLTRRALAFSRRLGRMCLDYVFSDAGIQRVTAYVIEGLTSAKNYCLKLGFKDEGFRRNVCMKAGKLLGVHVLGMTRKDWEFSK